MFYYIIMLNKNSAILFTCALYFVSLWDFLLKLFIYKPEIFDCCFHLKFILSILWFQVCTSSYSD